MHWPLPQVILAIATLLTGGFSIARATHSAKTVHVFVALADNEHQGIVPTSTTLGNGEDPANNLYWGARYGVKSHFANSKMWMLVQRTVTPKDHVLERVVFQHRSTRALLVADAYRGKSIRQAIEAFLLAAAGGSPEDVTARINATNHTFGAGGRADLAVYVGHDGLMEFNIDNLPTQQDQRRHDVMVLACASKVYFREPVRKTGAHPLLWTTQLMAPEAYTLEAALEGWVRGETGEQIRERAAQAYNAYQKCGIRGARALFVTGWGKGSGANKK